MSTVHSLSCAPLCSSDKIYQVECLSASSTALQPEPEAAFPMPTDQWFREHAHPELDTTPLTPEDEAQQIKNGMWPAYPLPAWLVGVPKLFYPTKKKTKTSVEDTFFGVKNDRGMSVH